MRSCFIPRAQKAWCQLFLFSLLYIYIYIFLIFLLRGLRFDVSGTVLPLEIADRQASSADGRTNERDLPLVDHPSHQSHVTHYISIRQGDSPPPDNHHGREGKMPALDPQLLRGFAEHTTRALLHSRSVPRHEILEAFLVRESSFFLSFFV